MAEQERIHPQLHEESSIGEVEDVQPAGSDFDVDALLDDIDTILESNASAFVESFVQKGGQ